MIRKEEPNQESVDNELEGYSMRIAELFAMLSELPRRETLESDMAMKVSEQADEISKEIRLLVKAMNELRDRTGLWCKRDDKEHESESSQLRQEAEEERLRLRRRLGQIADAQVALVAEWNADPSAAKRQVFEGEYRRLAGEYSKVLGELQLVRARISKM